VLLSAFNALTLSPRACGFLLLKPRTPSPGNCCGDSSLGFNRLFERTTEGLRPLERAYFSEKTVVLVVLLVAFGVSRPVFFCQGRLPSSFLPDEDQGYAFINLQLPNGASLERTTAVAADVEKNPSEYSWRSVLDQRRRFQFAQLCAPPAL